ncbi:unnamed protein product [Ectocarpus sp. 4 AP-2014]
MPADRAYVPKETSSTMSPCQQRHARWPRCKLLRLPMLLLQLIFLAALVSFDFFSAAALTTVLDQRGFPLLQAPGAEDHRFSRREDTQTCGRGSGGGLRQVDLVHIGTFAVQHASTVVKRSSSSRRWGESETSHLPDYVLELLAGREVGTRPGSGKKKDGTDGGSAATSPGAVEPLILLNGHVCTILSLGEPSVGGLGSEGADFLLQEPYAWESDEEAEGFVLPPWMWDAVGGEMGGGSLLMTQATIANITGDSSCWPPHRKGNYSDHIASVDEYRVDKDSRDIGRDGCFEPFLQLASWGQGRFNPLAQFASRELLLGGVSGGERRSATTEAPLGTRPAGKNTTGGNVMHAIRTREGSLEIAPVGDLHLQSGIARPGGEVLGGDVHVAARGEHGLIFLRSVSLEWSPASPSLSDCSSSDCHSRGAVASLRVDDGTLEATGFSEALRLSSARSFEVAITAASEEQKEGGENDGIGHEQGAGVGEGPHQHGFSSGSGLETKAALLKGDAGSLNTSAGVVNVEATDTLLAAGRNGVRVTSSAGDVRVDARGPDGSVVVRGGSVVAGVAPTVSFIAEAAAAGEEAKEEEDRERAPGGGYLTLTVETATIGGPQGGEGEGALLEADDEVRLRVSNSSLLRVSAAEVSLHTPAIVLRSSSPLTAAAAVMGRAAAASSNGDGGDPAPLQQPPPSTGRQDPGIRGPGPTAAAELSLDDSGDVAVVASGSIGMETPGAFVQLSGRRSGGDGLAAGGRDDGEGLDRGGLLVAEAGDVRIVASAGVSVVATDGADARAWAEEGASNGTAAAGGRLEVFPGGVSAAGTSTSLDASERVALRVGGLAKRRTAVRPESDGGVQSAAEGEEVKSSATVELGDWGVRVLAGASAASSDDNNKSNNNGSSNTSSTILLNAGSRLVFVAPQLAISHEGGGGAGAGEEGSARRHRAAGSSTIPFSDGGGGGGGGGLWSDGLALTGRADERVLLQAGLGSTSESGSKERAQDRAGSHISVEESWIHLCAGGGGENSLPALSSSRTASATAASTAAETVARGRGGSGCTGGLGGGEGPSRKGLMVEAIGAANISSTEDLRLRAEGSIQISSPNDTSLYSPRGILLSGSSPRNDDGGGGGGGKGTPSADHKESPSLDGAGLRGKERNGLGLRQEGGGHVLLAPGDGSGVGIGRGFSSRHLASAAAVTSGSVWLPRSTLSLPWSPRAGAQACLCFHLEEGSRSAVRFGCEGLPYSGGLEVRHHLEGRGGDTLVLELASSPGRVVGDARGRWGVGAVPDADATGVPTQLSAALHVFAAVSLPTVAAPSGLGGGEPTKPAVASVLVESPAGSAGVMQMLSVGGSRSRPSVPELSPAPDNTIVLSSRQSGETQEGSTHNHWVVSQLAAGRDKKAGSASRPQWADPHADHTSWAGGMTLTHVVAGGGPSGWRPALETAQQSSSSSSPLAAGAGAPGGDHGGMAARPAVAFGVDGRAGFGTCSTGARVTVGGALMAEQVLVLSDEGMVRDVESLGAQGNSQALEAVREVDVVTFGWTKEASSSYGLDLGIRQLGIIAQQAEREKRSSSLAWRDAATGRKAVSHSRLLATLVAAFQHLDASIQANGTIRDARLQEIERASASSQESSEQVSDRLEAVEAMAKRGLDSLLAQGRDVSTLEGRLMEQGGQAEGTSAVLARVQESTAQERGETQEWRRDRTLREKRLEEEIIELKDRLAAQEDQTKALREDHDSRTNSQDEQIRALSLRIGTVHASQSSKCDSSLQAELEALRQAQVVLEDRITGLAQRVHQDPALNEEAMFLEAVKRLEDTLLTELPGGRIPQTTRPTSGDALPSDDIHPASGARRIGDLEAQSYLENHKESVRLGAMAAVLRHREHLMAVRQMDKLRN